MFSTLRRPANLLIFAVAALCPTLASAASFSDVPGDHPAYAAVEYLRSKGILEGYADGTFKPDEIVNRAAAVKVIVSGREDVPELDDRVTSAYDDIPDGSWYLPFVEYARVQLKIIDGPPKKTNFEGSRAVTRAEFLKMFELGQGADPLGAFAEITAGLAQDTSDKNDWFYPYMRYALSASMTQVTAKGNLNPNMDLDRGSMALLMHRYYLYKDGKRTKDLLASADADGGKVINYLEKADAAQASYAATRATIAARGALLSTPDEPIVKGAVKITEGLELIVQAYRTAASGKYDDVIAKCKDAWNLGAAAEEFSPTLAPQGEQIKLISTSLADQARKLKK
ncbi:MAG: S-layer homology domain-containing protein [Candidatus Peribacteraceae bacterium]|nr:S-layer homology domain-containing protein [Candidatus Peribacteraceae bacterium]